MNSNLTKKHFTTNTKPHSSCSRRLNWTYIEYWHFIYFNKEKGLPLFLSPRSALLTSHSTIYFTYLLSRLTHIYFLCYPYKRQRRKFTFTQCIYLLALSGLWCLPFQILKPLFNFYLLLYNIMPILHAYHCLWGVYESCFYNPEAANLFFILLLRTGREA